MATRSLPLAPPPPGAPPPPQAGVAADNLPPSSPSTPVSPESPAVPPVQNRGVQNQGFPWLLVISAGVVVVLLLCWALWPSGSKKPAGTPADPAAKQSDLNRVEGETRRLEKERAVLATRVETLENRPDHVGASSSSVRNLDRKVEGLAGEVGALGDRVGELEKRQTAPLTVEQPEKDPLTEADLRELDERYFDALRRGRLPN